MVEALLDSKFVERAVCDTVPYIRTGASGLLAHACQLAVAQTLALASDLAGTARTMQPEHILEAAFLLGGIHVNPLSLPVKHRKHQNAPAIEDAIGETPAAIEEPPTPETGAAGET